MKRIIITLLMLPLIIGCNHRENAGSQASGELGGAVISPDTLPFTISKGNNILFKAVLGERDTLDLFFDTGGTELVMTHRAIREKTSLLEGKNHAYEEEDYALLEGYYSLALDQLKWDSLTIFPTRVGPEEADGHFGWDLFEDKVVELDYDKQLMIIHPELKGKLTDYAKVDIEYLNTLFCIQGNIKVGEKLFSDRFLFDTGFQRAVILDKELREKSGFPDDLPVIKESKLKNSAGTEFINRVVLVDELCLNQTCASEVPIQLLATPNPAGFETHILGNEFLMRFNTILDFQHDCVYLKPNSLMDLPYKDAS